MTVFPFSSVEAGLGNSELDYEFFEVFALKGEEFLLDRKFLAISSVS